MLRLKQHARRCWGPHAQIGRSDARGVGTAAIQSLGNRMRLTINEPESANNSTIG